MGKLTELITVFKKKTVESAKVEYVRHFRQLTAKSTQSEADIEKLHALATAAGIDAATIDRHAAALETEKKFLPLVSQMDAREEAMKKAREKVIIVRRQRDEMMAKSDKDIQEAETAFGITHGKVVECRSAIQAIENAKFDSAILWPEYDGHTREKAEAHEAARNAAQGTRPGHIDTFGFAHGGL